MDVWDIDELDTLESMVFSGDKLHDEDTLKLFKDCLERWSLEAKRIEEMLEERKNDENYEN